MQKRVISIIAFSDIKLLERTNGLSVFVCSKNKIKYLSNQLKLCTSLQLNVVITLENAKASDINHYNLSDIILLGYINDLSVVLCCCNDNKCLRANTVVRIRYIRIY